MKTIKVCAIMADKEGKILLQLRDEEPGKDTWVLFGGGLENGETEEQALRREIKEELGCAIGNIIFFGNYENNGIGQAVYVVTDPVDPKGLVLGEGGGMGFFSAAELQTLKIGFNFKYVIDDYLSRGRPGFTRGTDG